MRGFASYALQAFDFTTLANPGTVPSMDIYALMHRETAIPRCPNRSRLRITSIVAYRSLIQR